MGVVMIIRMIMLFLILSSMPLSAFSFKDLFFKDYSKKEPRDTVADLQNQQVNNPNDPQINYNLGVALYKTNDYSGAKENFKRALDFGKDTLVLRERCYFNLGNTNYQQTMQLLGYDWESKKIEPQVLGEATKTISEAIENYKNVLVLNKEDDKAQKNKNVAEELLKKLKKKQAEQQNKDKNKDKDNKQDKDNKDKDSENKDGEKGDDKDKEQNKNDDKDKEDENKDNKEKKENKKDNEKNKDKKGDEKKQDQQKDKQGNDKEDKQENKPEEKQNQQGQDKQDKKDKNEKQPESEGKDQSQQKEEQQPQANKQEKGKKPELEKAPEEEKKIQGQQQAQPAKQQDKKPEDSFEKRQANAVLDSLEQQEANLQKALIFRNVHNRQQRQTTSQRPW